MDFIVQEIGVFVNVWRHSKFLCILKLLALVISEQKVNTVVEDN